jgi:hypothetical protein
MVNRELNRVFAVFFFHMAASNQHARFILIQMKEN